MKQIKRDQLIRIASNVHKIRTTIRHIDYTDRARLILVRLDNALITEILNEETGDNI